MNSGTVKLLRDQYPPGTRIELEENSPAAPGTKGTILAVDDAGTIEVKCDNGRILGLIPSEDSFQVLPAEPASFKMYMPLVGTMYDEDYGNESFLEGPYLVEYEDKIVNALEDTDLPEEEERGIMHWYHEKDTIDEKVRSVKFDVEYRDGQLWGIAECRVMGTLEPEEMAALKEYITGQAADGWGESLEQRDIRTGEGTLHVRLWNSSGWSLKTEEELFGSPRQERGMSLEPGF